MVRLLVNRDFMNLTSRQILAVNGESAHDFSEEFFDVDRDGNECMHSIVVASLIAYLTYVPGDGLTHLYLYVPKSEVSSFDSDEKVDNKIAECVKMVAEIIKDNPDTGTEFEVEVIGLESGVLYELRPGGSVKTVKVMSTW